VPDELEALLKALSATSVPVSGSFPGSFAAAPASFRAASAQPVVDARQELIEGVSAAVLFHGLWWSFWDRAPIAETPSTKSGSFSVLTVFPDFEGRNPCGGW
jgi:hypothetical protein